MKKISVNTIKNLKKDGQKITALTAYDYSTAKYLDESGIDIIMVGDSLAMVALGYETTHSIGMEEMLIFTKAVARGSKRAMVIADMPFMSYHTDLATAVKNTGEMIRAGAKAVKIEGYRDYILEVIKRCTQSGIPVMGHLGFTPQFLNTIGGYNIQGKTFDKTLEILEQAKQLEKAGAFAIVLEMVPEESAKYITDNLNVPTIGIGAGRYCSGQILVSDDIFGKFCDFTPKFARKYGELSLLIKNCATQYIKDVQSGNFPSKEEVFKLSEEEQKQLEIHSGTYKC
ncbi:MAG TPA: 3-methyl-2-oxobutanoate hydroxymethyltransferase [Candidatus Gastranaerophilaceae bacterium]|nr:3-methyl-2-oxobutanoate hydroxymethyltransferase [Candidatus Gastranaerophilaceae bacterium]